MSWKHLLGCALVIGACATAPDPAPRVPAEVSSAAWEADIARFVAEDAAAPPPRGAVLFVGSSSIRMWHTLAADFPGVPVINRGFGGSELRDSTWYADRIIAPYAPRLIVLYAGDNDLFSGRTPAQLLADFVAFVARVRRDLPAVPIAYISTKPSPARAHLLAVQRDANARIRAAIGQLDHAVFVDVFTPMLDSAGQPRAELFGEDQLHLNAAGYQVWQQALAPYVTRSP